MKFEWTDAAMLRALQLRKQGYSINQIAAELGTSRGAVSGIFKRIADDERAAGEDV